MWIRKSPQELTREHRARGLLAGLCAPVAAILILTCGIPYAGFNVATSVRIAGLLAAGILLLAWRRAARRWRVRSGLWVCETCNLATVNQTTPTCVCGGILTPIPQMKWGEVQGSTEERVSEAKAKRAVALSHAV